MLGSLSEADDAVQAAWLRLCRTDADEVENLGEWLTTVVARVSLNMLRSRRSRHEEPLDTHVPEPIVDRADGTDLEHEALLADSVGLALLVVLETLNPAERLAFVLHDMFAVPFDEIAPIVDRSPEAARQLTSRARRRVQSETTAPDADLETQREVIDAFLAAACEGDFEARLEVLDPDVVLRSDRAPFPSAPRGWSRSMTVRTPASCAARHPASVTKRGSADRINAPRWVTRASRVGRPPRSLALKNPSQVTSRLALTSSMLPIWDGPRPDGQASVRSQRRGRCHRREPARGLRRTVLQPQ
jgi:RNA polymerase sigma factor (sigma-70 family)